MRKCVYNSVFLIEKIVNCRWIVYWQRRTYALGFQKKVADSTRIPEKKVADSSRIPGKEKKWQGFY